MTLDSKTLAISTLDSSLLAILTHHPSPPPPPQCCVHMDQSPRGGCGAGGIRAGGPGPGGPGHQRRPGGALSHCWGGGGGGPRCHPHQLARGEATHAPQRWIPG